MVHVDDAATPEVQDEASSPGATDGRWTIDTLFLVSVATALLPILIATVRAVRRGWVPVGDNAYFAVRSMDVFTEHHPLLGTWTSASLNTDSNFNNPGPLMFDLFALPVRVLGPGIGLGIGTALLNALAVVGIAVVVRRRGGPLLATAAMAMTTVLCWSMGSELLYDPWQPHSLLLTFLFLLVLVWSLVCGDLAALPWAVFVGSVVVQTHLSYAILLVALSGWGMGSLAFFLRRARAAEPAAWPALRRRALRSWGVAAIVGLLCWAQPFGEQLASGRDGNLSRLAENAASSKETVGVKLGTRIVADVLTVPPFWLRPEIEEAFRPAVNSGRYPHLPTLAIGTGLLSALAVGLAALWWDARRRGDRVISAALSTAGVACAAGLVTAWNMPIGPLRLLPHHFYWLWPTATFTALALLVALLRRSSAVANHPRRAVIVLVGATALVAALTLPSYHLPSGPAGQDYAYPVVKKLMKEMEALEGEGPLLVDQTGGAFGEPYSGPIMAELQRRDIPFVFDKEGLIRQFGPSRRLDGDAQRLIIRQGSLALVTPDGMRRVVLVDGLSKREHEELLEVTAEVIDHLESLPQVPLNERGKRVMHFAEVDGNALVESGALTIMIETDLLDLDPRVESRFDRFAELHQRLERDTVGLFLAPLEA